MCHPGRGVRRGLGPRKDGRTLRNLEVLVPSHQTLTVLRGVYPTRKATDGTERLRPLIGLRQSTKDDETLHTETVYLRGTVGVSSERT